MRMTWNTIRLIIAIATFIFVLILLGYTRHLERKLQQTHQMRFTEHMVGMILCKLLVEKGMSEGEIESKVNAELSKMKSQKERR